MLIGLVPLLMALRQAPGGASMRGSQRKKRTVTWRWASVLALEIVWLVVGTFLLTSCGQGQPGKLTVSPTQIDVTNAPGHTGCTSHPQQGCISLLTLTNSGGSDLQWSASGTVGGEGGRGTVEFRPAQGALSPGQVVTVTIAIKDLINCPALGLLTFTSVNTVKVLWDCAETTQPGPGTPAVP